MKLKRNDLFKLFNALSSLKGKFNKHFQLYVFDNINILEPMVKSMSEVFKPSEKFMEFEKKRNDILKRLAEKDDKGSPKTYIDPYTKADSYYILPDNIKIAQEEIRVLQEPYRDAIDENINQQKEADKILQEDVDVNIRLIPFEYFPDELDEKFKPLFMIVDRGDK